MKEYLIYAVISVICFTGISHVVLSEQITKIRDVAVNNPARLRGTTVEEALEKVAHWEQLRKRLWPLSVIVVAGLLFTYFM